MAREEFVLIGVLLIVLAGGGYFIAIPFTLAGESVSITIPNVVAFCDSGIGQFAQMSPEIVKICSEFNTLMFGIYGSGILGIGLIIVGAVVPGKRHEEPTYVKDKRKEWSCEHCDYKTKAEEDLIEHYKLDHAEKKGDSFQRKYGKKPISAETMEILKRRYAKGEITKEEFEDMKKDLENS